MVRAFTDSLKEVHTSLVSQGYHQSKPDYRPQRLRYLLENDIYASVYDPSVYDPSGYQPFENDLRSRTEVFARRALAAQSLLLRYGATATVEQISELYALASDSNTWRACFLEAVCSAPNPFIPGFNLLKTLRETADRTIDEGKKRHFEDLEQDILQLLEGVLEQLPKTVDSCRGQMLSCVSIFEAQTSSETRTGFNGPLNNALQHHNATRMLCSQPLWLDYMLHKFGSRSLLLSDTSSSVKHYQTPAQKAMLILSASHAYYKVPKWRMLLDLEVYILVIFVFSTVILRHSSEIAKVGEMSFVMYLAVSETCQIRWGAILISSY